MIGTQASQLSFLSGAMTWLLVGQMLVCPDLGQTENRQLDSSASPTPYSNSQFQSHEWYSTPDTWNETADQTLIYDQEVLWTRHLNKLLKLPKWIDFGLENRTRFESLSYPYRQGEVGTQAQIPQRSRIRLGIDGPGPLRFLFEGQDSRTHVLAGEGSTVDNTMVDEWSVLQLFASVTLPKLFNTDLRADGHFGRFTMDMNKRRLIARNFFRNTTNNFQGGHLQLGRDNDWKVRTFLVLPVIRLTNARDTQDTDSVFWGVNYISRKDNWLQRDFYYYGLNDRETSASNPPVVFHTFGLRLFKDHAPGELDYEIESDWQFGSFGQKDHFGFYQHFEMGYTLDSPWKPRFLFQYDYSSGTRDPNGSQNGQFNSLFGARNFDLDPTSLFSAFARENISTPGYRIILKPIKRVIFHVVNRFWWLAQAKDEWVGTGLQDPTGQSGNFLGSTMQLKAVWHFVSALGFEFGYIHFFKGSYVENLARIPGNPPANDSDYFYASTKSEILNARDFPQKMSGAAKWFP